MVVDGRNSEQTSLVVNIFSPCHRAPVLQRPPSLLPPVFTSHAFLYPRCSRSPPRLCPWWVPPMSNSKNVNPWRLSCSSIATITITGPSESSYWWALLSFREVQRFWLMRFATFLFQGSKREQCDHLGLYTGWPEPHFYYRYQRQRHLPQRCLLHCGICRPLSEGPCTLFSPLSLSCSCFFF